MKVSKASVYGLHALMYMLRHLTQLPATLETTARAGLVRFVRGRRRGYVFAKPPEEIALMEQLETLEGHPLFDDCPLRHCLYGGTPQNCRIYAKWVSGTRKIRDIFEETTIVTVAWNHPEHRFDEPPRQTEAARMEIKSGPAKKCPHKEEPAKLH